MPTVLVSKTTQLSSALKTVGADTTIQLNTGTCGLGMKAQDFHGATYGYRYRGAKGGNDLVVTVRGAIPDSPEELRELDAASEKVHIRAYVSCEVA